MPESKEEIDLLLTCGHIVLEDTEGLLYTPSIGDKRTCNVCKRDVHIAKVGVPMRKIRNKDQNKKPR